MLAPTDKLQLYLIITGMLWYNNSIHITNNKLLNCRGDHWSSFLTVVNRLFV